MAKNSIISVERIGPVLVFKGAGREAQLDMGALSDEIKDFAIAHGLKQKVIDAAALMRDPATGASASPEEKMAAVEAMVARLASGQLNGPRGSGGGILLDALCLAYPERERGDLRDWLADKDDKAKRALRQSAKLRPIIAELEKRMSGNGAGDALLDELG